MTAATRSGAASMMIDWVEESAMWGRLPVWRVPALHAAHLQCRSADEAGRFSAEAAGEAAATRPE
ncbi:hypothetical protein Vqi01_05560 [Micromonospora qiuiae]|uniref:Uncharacterized protein n=1 Tax=Micromonospora qiuiae TaxID=502268 RepID=A0ABQ4J5F6_9ACTN|nr:hypothetical protein Vqi01_05560 [Micromonospora qiuiae]